MTVLMTPDMANFSGNVHGRHISCFDQSQVDFVHGSWHQGYGRGHPHASHARCQQLLFHDGRRRWWPQTRCYAASEPLLLKTKAASCSSHCSQGTASWP